MNFFSFSRNSTVVILLGVIIFFGFLPFFTGRFVYDDDSTFYFLPAFSFYHDALASGKSFLLAPGIFSGFPLYLSQVGGFIEPINYIIFSVFPVSFGYIFRVFLNYFFAAWFMYLFCRKLGIQKISSFFAALTFVTAQHIMGGMQIQRSNSFPFLPGLFYVVISVMQLEGVLLLRRIWLTCVGAIIFLVGMLGGYMQLNLHALVGLLFFIIFISWQRVREKKTAYPLFMPYATIGTMFFAGSIIFYPYLSRVLELIAYTGRSGGVSWQDAGGGVSPWGVFPAVIGKLGSFFSFFFLPTFKVPDVVDGGVFIGFSAIMVIVASFWIKKEKEWYFFGGLYLFSIFATIPPFSWLFYNYTPMHYFRNVGFWLIFPGTFALSMLAGLSLDSLLLLKDRVLRVRIFARSMALICGAFFIYLFIFFTHWESGLIISNMPQGWEIFLSFLLFVCSIAWFWYALYQDDRAKYVYIIFLCVTAASFILPIWILSYKWGTSVETSTIFERPWVYEEIKKREGDNTAFRTYNFYPGDSQWHFFVKPKNPTAQGLQDFQREISMQRLYPALHEYASIRGFDNLETRRYARVREYIETNRNFFGAVVTPEDLSKPSVFLTDPKIFNLLGMMNVKYMWSVLFLLPEDGGAYLDYLPIGSPLGPELPIHLVENKMFIPRVSSPQKIIFLKEGEENFSEIITSGIKFSENGFIECVDCVMERQISQTLPQITDVVYENDSVRFHTSGGKDSWVIIANGFLPRWHAYVDSEETRIYYANYIYQGIKVPSGDHEVELRYKW